MGANDSAQVAGSRRLLKKIETLVETHDKFLMLDKMAVIEFCEDPDNGLVQILLALETDADAIGFDKIDKDIIEEMIHEVPKRIKRLRKLSATDTERDNIERDTKDIIRKFIKKPCREYLRKFGITPDIDTLKAPGQSKFRPPDFEDKDKAPATGTHVKKIKKLITQFHNLTYLLLDLRYGVDLCLYADDNSLEDISPGWVTAAETFRETQRRLISDIKSDIPEKDWKRISDTDVKLSGYIDKLIEDFDNITDRKAQINSTMKNLRREYKTLWTDLWEAAL